MKLKKFNHKINQKPKECKVRILCNPKTGNIILQTADGNSMVTVIEEQGAVYDFLLNLKGKESPPM